MKDLFKNRLFVVLLCVSLIIVTCAAVFNMKGVRVPFVENAVSVIIKPFQSAITYSVNGVSGFFGRFSDVGKLQKENAKLKDDINVLNEKLRKVQSYKDENDRLKELLELKQQSTDFEYTAASVIARDYGGWYESFTVNKGEADGVKMYNAVVTTEGLVGCVTEVGKNYARVLSIIDSTSSVGAEVSRTKEITMIDGDIELKPKGLCKLSNSTKKASVIPGDLLETSGLGDVYPKGILIGKVTEVDSDGHKGYTIIKPAVNFEKINEVLIITGEK